jgi:hypothetical protein
MRFIKTFVLHLYVDLDTPERLCGNLHPLEKPASYLFKNQTELVKLLQWLIETPLSSKPSSPEAESGPDVQLKSILKEIE